MKTIAFDTWLPFFPGFYNTGMDTTDENPDYEWDLWNDPQEVSDDIKNLVSECWYECVDYSAYHEAVAVDWCNYIQDKMRDCGLNSAMVTFQNLNSPKEYNFANDSIDCQISMSRADWQTVLKGCNTPSFYRYIKKRYTSYDGFFSHYSSDGRVWLESFINLLSGVDMPRPELNADLWVIKASKTTIPANHLIGRVLSFYLSKQEDLFSDNNAVYDYLIDGRDIYWNNYFSDTDCLKRMYNVHTGNSAYSSTDDIVIDENVSLHDLKTLDDLLKVVEVKANA